MLATSAVSDNRVEYEKLQLMCADLENQTKTLNTQLCAKQTELEKCHARINSLEAELKMHGDTVQLLERAKKEWTTRSSGLLSKFIKSDPAETQTVQEENVPVKVSLITAQDEKHTADAKTGESAKEKETLNELNNMKRQLHKYQTFASQLTAKLTATKAELNAKKEEHTSLKETVEGLNEKNRELQQSQANLTKEFDELKGKYTKVLYRIKESIRKEVSHGSYKQY
ncbi:hypothetical protein BX666DRAFT_1944596 [Dichotomocladium elegans]|nr:hypothetical protein BX666DRAFT_1944596 [Dichotomocladium elegans]